MSIIVAIDGQGVKSFRKSSLTVGLDVTGEIVFSDEDTYLITPHLFIPYLIIKADTKSILIKKRGVSVGDAFVLEGTELVVEDYKIIRIKKKKFSLMFSNQEAELLSYAEVVGIQPIMHAKEEAKKVIFTSLDGQEIKSFMIPGGITFRCGSSENDAVFIETDFLRKAHFDMKVLKDNQLQLKPCTGLLGNVAREQVLQPGESILISSQINLTYVTI